MIVSRSSFEGVLERLVAAPKLSLDTETTGLRPYHGDRLFSLILGVPSGGNPLRVAPYYFNFQPYADVVPDLILPTRFLRQLDEALFKDAAKLWYIQYAKYDMAILANEGIELAGTVHCTRAMGRIEYNEHQSYDLDSAGERIGFPKDKAVEQYISQHGLWDWATIPGKKAREKNKHYDRVPLNVILPYGERDAEVCAHIGHSQEASFQAVAARQTNLEPRARLQNIVDNERKLTKVVFRMEQRGVLIDRPYTEKALAYETDRAQKAMVAFKRETGRDFSASPKLFEEVFESDKALWIYGDETKTGQVNPSFDSDALKRFANPAAAQVLAYRDAKSRADFYSGFIYHADRNGVVHPTFNPDGTRTGRFSSSNPNLQNMTSEEGDEDQEFIVRRAIIPRPGFLFIMPDYDQMEYRMMLDYAGELGLVQKVLGGLDVHQATAAMMGVERGPAKTLNFMLLYGGGVAKLCIALFKPSVGETLLKEICMRFLYNKSVPRPSQIPPDVVAYNLAELRKAAALREQYFSALPKVQEFIASVIEAVNERGFIRNWAGRRCYYPNLEYDYTAPNTLIQGGTADVNKFGLVEIDEYLACKKSKLVLTIHDENPIEVHEDEVDEVPRQVKTLMESVYPYKHLPLTVGMEWSRKSLGDKTKGFPVPRGGESAPAFDPGPRLVGSAHQPEAHHPAPQGATG